MISTQILQNILVEIATITGVSAAIYSSDGKELASKGTMSDISRELLGGFVRSGLTTNSEDDLLYLNRVNQGIDNDYICAVKKDSANAYMASRLISVQLENLIEVSNIKANKDSFIRNLLLDNLLQIDLYNRSRRLNIEFEEPRAVFVIKARPTVFQPLHETLKKLVPLNSKDFIAGLDENNQIIIHSIKDEKNYEDELKNFAEQILETVDKARMENVSVAYGSKVNELKDVSNSYKEANFAHDVRRIFYEDKRIISYDELGVGRLIYQLPINICHLFINEIFSETKPEDFDDDILETVNKFFENNLNVSESSRQLFIHRNTLVYRLDKLQKQTGLDLRIFDDAMTFKIALMVVKYINNMKNTGF